MKKISSAALRGSTFIIIVISIVSFIFAWQSFQAMELLIGDVAIESANCKSLDAKIKVLTKLEIAHYEAITIFKNSDPLSPEIEIEEKAYSKVRNQRLALEKDPMIMNRELLIEDLDNVRFQLGGRSALALFALLLAVVLSAKVVITASVEKRAGLIPND